MTKNGGHDIGEVDRWQRKDDKETISLNHDITPLLDLNLPPLQPVTCALPIYEVVDISICHDTMDRGLTRLESFWG